MYYYIDGYNLLFRLLYSDRDFSVKRQQLIEELSDKLKQIEIDATIVFDSHYRQEESTRTHYHHLEIIFTSPGETADDRIIAEVEAETNPHHITVVTSDKKLAWFARRCHAKTESIEQFLDWMNKRYKKRQKEIPKKAPIIPKPIVAKKPLPAPEKPPESCFEYYLKTFESRLDKLEESKPREPSKRKPTPKKRKIPNVVEEEKSFSEMDRWLRLFESRLREGP